MHTHGLRVVGRYRRAPILNRMSGPRDNGTSVASISDVGVILPLEVIGTVEADRFLPILGRSGTGLLGPSHFSGYPLVIMEAKSSIERVKL